MRTKFILFALIVSGCISCANQTSEEKTVAAEVVPAPNPESARFTFSGGQDTTIKDGESITKYKSGQIKMIGIMKGGKREGLWKSFYENGIPWSETTFVAGIRNGKTRTWFENGSKRYEGAYKNDLESGSWTYWDEKGNEVATKDYDKK